MLLSPDMQDWVGEKHLARFVVATIERMDLSRLEASYEGRGERAYHPKMLTALLFYGYATGVFSSRKLERACLDSIACRFIACNTSPDHDTIADFRKRVLPELSNIFLEILLLAQEMQFLKVGQISLDGTKIKANASKHHALSYAHAGKIKAKLRREIAKLMKRAEAADNEPDPDLNIPAEITRRKALIANIDEARAKIAAREAERHELAKAAYAERLAQREQQRQSGSPPKGRPPQPPAFQIDPKAQINLSDEESRIMPTADGFVQGFNAQAAVAMESQFVIAVDVVQATNDKQQLAPTLEKLAALPEALGKPSDLAADAGYFSASNVLACEDAGIVPYLAMKREAHHSWLQQKLRPAQPEPRPDATAVERMAHRLQTKEGREIYAKRKQTVEPVFGIAKNVMGFRSFFLRGLENVRGEWKLVCSAYNIKHLHALVAACPDAVVMA